MCNRTQGMETRFRRGKKAKLSDAPDAGVVYNTLSAFKAMIFRTTGRGRPVTPPICLVPSWQYLPGHTGFYGFQIHEALPSSTFVRKDVIPEIIFLLTPIDLTRGCFWGVCQLPTLFSPALERGRYLL